METGRSCPGLEAFEFVHCDDDHRILPVHRNPLGTSGRRKANDLAELGLGLSQPLPLHRRRVAPFGLARLTHGVLPVTNLVKTRRSSDGGQGVHDARFFLAVPGVWSIFPIGNDAGLKRPSGYNVGMDAPFCLARRPQEKPGTPA